MFEVAIAFDQDIGGWNTSKVENMARMFKGWEDVGGNITTTIFNQNINEWDVSNVTDMEGMFNWNTSFNQALNGWGSSVSIVENMQYMFKNATAFNQYIGNWNTTSVTTMRGMFYGASEFNQDIGNWNIVNVTTMYEMFRGATKFDQNITLWDPSSIQVMSNMFSGATAMNATYGTITGYGSTPSTDFFTPPIIYTTTNNITTATFSKHGDFSDGVLRNCTALLNDAPDGKTVTKVVVTSGITSIDSNAFANASDLTSVTLPDTIDTIGSNAFESTGLTSIYIPSSVTTIGSSAFKSTSLDTISIVSSSSIANEAFLSSSSSSTIVEVRGTYTTNELNTWIATNVTDVTKFSNAQQVVYNTETFAFTYDTLTGDSVDTIKITGSNYGVRLGEDDTLGYATGIIPSTINSLDVTRIGTDAFKDCIYIATVSIPESVATIDSNAFEGCTSLATLGFDGTSVCESIGSNAFKSCSSVTEIVIPESMTTIGSGVFENCSSLSILEFSGTSTCTSIGSDAFKNTNLTGTLTLPASINTVTPGSVSVIGTGAFHGTSITEIVLMGLYNSVQISMWLANYNNRFPDGHSIILTREPLVYSFTTYSSFKKITGSNYQNYLDGDRTIPASISGNTVTHITQDAFKDTALNSIIIPSSITTIETGAFDGAPLTFIELNQITTINGIGAFLGIGNSSNSYKVFVKINELSNAVDLNTWKETNSSKFSIPVNVSGNIAFVTGSNSIVTEVSSTDNNQYVFNIINPTSSPKEVQLGDGTSGNGNGVISESSAIYTPPETFSGGMFKVTQIGTNAFSDKNTMTSFTIPNTVTSIGNNAFQSCVALATLAFAETSTCTSIGDNAFYLCSSLTTVSIPDSVTNIGDEAFKGSSLTSISVKSTTSIGTDAFSDMEVTGHVTVTVRGITSASELNTWKGIHASKFSLTSSSNKTITFVFDINNTPIMTETVAGINYVFIPMSIGSSNVQIGDGSSTVGNGTTTSGITTLDIPGTFSGGFTVTKIGTNAFADISSITAVTIPTSVTIIGNNAFKNTSITTFNLQTVTTIGANAFNGTDLTTITVPNTVTSIGASAFANTPDLHTISVSQNNVAYGSSAFATDSPTMISVTVRDISAASDLGTWKTTNSSYFTTDGSSDAPVAFLAGVGGFMTETVGNITYVFSFTSDSTDAEFKVRIGDGTTVDNNGTTTPTYIPTTFTPPTSFTGGFIVTEIGPNAFNKIPITDLTIHDNIIFIGADAFTDIGYIGGATVSPIIPPKPPKVTVPSSSTTAADLSNYGFASSFSGVNSMPVVFSTTSGIMIETGSNYVFTVVDSTATPQTVRIGTGGGTALQGNGLLTAPSSPGIISPPGNFRGKFYTVTKIGQKAFMGIYINNLILHPGLDEIAANAFKNIQGILTIKIPYSIQNIANYAFYQMTPSTQVTIIVEGTLGSTAYNSWLSANGGGTNKFTVSSGALEYVEGVLFFYSIIAGTNNVQITGSNNNDNLTGTCEIPESVVVGGVTYTVVSIGDNAFIGSQIEQLFLPTTITSIGNSAFKDVTTLTIVTYRTISTVETIGSNAFQNTSINEVIVPITMTSIGAGAFSNIGTLTLLSFTPGRSVDMTMTIGDTAFKSTAFTSVSFPNTVTSIGSEAFADIPNLRMIGVHKHTVLSKDSLPNTNTYMNTSTFSRLSNHTTVIVYGLSTSSVVESRAGLSDWQTNYETAFNLSFTAPDDAYIKFVTESGHIILFSFEGVFYVINIIGTGSDQKARIGNNTTSPGNGLAFPHLQYNDSISIPESCSRINIGGTNTTYSITKIGAHAFSYVDMSSVTIPSGITHVGSSAFYSASLNSLTFEETLDLNYSSTSSLIEIGVKAFMNAFQGETLTTITIPRNVETIKNNAFRRCFSIKQVSLSSSINIGGNAFRSMAPNLRILVTNTQTAMDLYVWRSVNESNFSSKDASDVRFIPYYEGVMSSVCFPAGTPIVTDQETIIIEKICVDRHTVGGNRIVAITRTTTEDECLIRVDPDALGKNIPSIPTIMSCMHSVLFMGDMIPVYKLANLEKVYKIPYTPGTLLFNVLLDIHSKMVINNMTVETLHPNNGISKFTRALLEVSDEGDRAEMMYAYNTRATELGVFTNMKHRL